MLKPPFLKRSLISGLIVIFPIFIYGADILSTSSNINQIGEPDNDPMRASWLFYYLSPFIFLIVSLFYYITARILFLLGRLSFIDHEIVILIFSLFIGVMIGHDAIKNFLLSSVIVFLLFSFGLLSWHYLDRLRYNKSS